MMKLILRVFFLFLFFSSTHLFSQVKFQRVYGNVDSTQDGLDIMQTTDGGYIINARITFFKTSSAAAQEDAYFLKVNSGGTLQWSKRHAGTNYEEGRSMVQTTDGGYFYAGETKSWGAGGFDAFATKTDALGNIQWTNAFGDVWDDAIFAVHQTTDGGYMGFGMSSNVATNGYMDFYLLKLGNAGNIQWTKTYGGTYMDFGYDGTQTSDGGYIMAGSSYPSMVGSGGTQFYMVKADVNGNFQWGRLVNGNQDDFARGVIQTNDGGYIAVGGTQSFGAGNTDVFLVKTTSDGTVSWTKTYGGFNNDCGFTVRQTNDGGYAVAGGTNSVGNGGYDLFLLKTNSNGNLLWTKTYGGTGDEGPSGGMFFLYSGTDRDVAMVNTSDGGFAIASVTTSFGNGHVYLVKTDSDGNSGCNETNGPFLETSPTPSVSLNGQQTNPSQLTAFPNPVVTTPPSKDTNVCCITPTAMAGNDVTICQSASTTLNVVGGGTYSWSPATGLSNTTIANPVATPIATTTYIVTVSDSCGSDKDTVIVKVNPTPAANAGADITICPGDNITLSGTGNGTYVWNPGGQTTSSIPVSPTSTTTYTFSATNSCGTANDNVTVTVNSSITATVSGNTSLCAGQSTTLTASGGSSFSWSNGSTINPISVTPTSSATYSVIATSGSCSDTTSITVNVTAMPVANIAGSATICAGQSATLTASGGGNYLWNTTATSSAITVSPTASTNYSVVVTNASGCSASASASVTVSGAPAANISGSTTVCQGDAATLTASGGGNYIWNTIATTSSITVSPTATTNYSVVVTSASGCSATANATVTVSPPPTAVINGNTTICSGQSATLTASGGTNYSWSTGVTTGSILVSPTSAATYSVIAITGTCSDTTSATISVNPLPVASVTSNTTICNGASATLTASGGGTYSWNPGGQTTTSIIISPTATSNYSVTVTNAIGCSNSANAQVTVSAGPNVSINGNTLLCRGDAATLTASGGNSYSWNTGATTATISGAPTSTTTYTVIASNASGCTSASTVTVTVSPPPVASVTGTLNICQGQLATLNASGGGTYSWSNGSTGSFVVVSSAGFYWVNVTIGSCKDSASATVTVYPPPVATAANNVTISQGHSTTLTATGGGTYSWSSGDATQTITVAPTVTTTYCVFVTDGNGCSDSACVKVTVTPIECSEGVYVPNAFSPNGDGDNDLFKVYFVNIACVKQFRMDIYNRWGEKLLQSTDPAFTWGGEYQGTIMNSCVVVYYMYVLFENGDEVSKKGNVSLVR